MVTQKADALGSHTTSQAYGMLNTHLDKFLLCFSCSPDSTICHLGPGVMSYAGCHCNLTEPITPVTWYFSDSFV